MNFKNKYLIFYKFKNYKKNKEFESFNNLL